MEMTYDTETEQRVARADLSEFHSRRRAHDREFGRLARGGASTTELDDLTDESDDMYARYEGLVDALLRQRP